MIILNEMVKLVIIALFALHQYIPNEEGNTKIFNDVREAQIDDILPAAHYTCRYLVTKLSGSALESVGLGGVNLGVDSLLELGFGMMSSEKFEKKFKKAKIDKKTLKVVMKTLCSESFSPTSFSIRQKREIFKFLKKYITILGDSDLTSFGQFNHFGSIKVYDRNAKEMAVIGSEHRVWTPFKAISKNLILALLATEDHNFFSHSGVQTSSIPRVALQGLVKGGGSGGSTLTMQMLKNAFFNEKKVKKLSPFSDRKMNTLLRKVREWYWALPYELAQGQGDTRLGKKKILENYLNLNSFGSGTQGVAEASHIYFRKTPMDISVAEAAFLALLFKAPSRYSNPRNYKERTLPRREYVLKRMLELKFITQVAFDEAMSEPLPTWKGREKKQTPTSFLPISYLVSQQVKKFNFPQKPNAKSLRIKTTINKNLQEIVFRSTNKILDSYDRQRDHIHRIRAARDGRSRIAGIRLEDLRWGESLLVKKVFRSIQKEMTDKKIQLSVYIGAGKYYNLAQDFPEKELAKFWTKTSRTRGQFYIAHNICTDENQEDLKTKKCLDKINTQDFSKELQSLLAESQKKISWNLVRNALFRVKVGASRKGIVPAYYNGRRLILSSGSPVSLTSSHSRVFRSKTRRRRGRFLPGQFFWVSPVKGGLYRLQSPKLQAAVVVINSKNGEVLANYGGYAPRLSQLDRSRQSVRQVGSTIKPWVYFMAAFHGVRMNEILPNSNVTLHHKGRPYTPRNYSKNSQPWIPFRKALEKSQNIATVSLLLNRRWGRGDWRENLGELREGLEAIQLYRYVKNEPSIVLGAQETSLLRLASSYTGFSNGSYISSPQFLKSISDEYGHTFFRNSLKRVNLPYDSPRSMAMIQSILINIANTGTAASLRGFATKLGGRLQQRCFAGRNRQNCFAGKTGTTNNNRDNWFIGFSKNFVIGVFVGYDVPKNTGGTGGALALPIFKEIIRKGRGHLPPIVPITLSTNSRRSIQSIPLGCHSGRENVCR